MEEFAMEGRGEKNASQVYVRRKLTRDHDCFILAWDKMLLPEQFFTWTEYLYLVYNHVMEKTLALGKPNSRHDKELAIYEGRMIPE